MLAQKPNQEPDQEIATPKQGLPVTVITGFLGSGKTTTLQHLLDNSEGRRIGVVVNDVASVNIDAKLVQKQQSNNNDDDGVVELQNGCACCSIADELLGSIELLQSKKKDWDAIVVELSGVADPVAVQNLWKQAVREGLPVTETADLQSTVTLVDASTFGTDYMTWDFALDRWSSEEELGDGCSGNRKISELLAEQVEAAQLVLLNKKDMTDETQLKLAETLINNLNPKANVIPTSFGKTKSVSQLLDAAAKSTSTDSCTDPACTDESHSHDHKHATVDAGCSEPGCTDSSHSHDHQHASTDAACNEPGCTDTTHSHDHQHGSADEACSDPGCNDPSHSHSHSHSKTAVDSLGITNFVYRSARPFDANRLSQLLFQWPIPKKDTLLDIFEETKSEDAKKSPFAGIVRSKGFAWIAPSAWEGVIADTWRHDAVVYWSHAGKHLDLQQNAGTWWADIPDEERRKFLADGYERVMKEDFVSEEFGDRRQELVFIGLDVQQEAIEAALDSCLLDEEEMVMYREKVAALRKAQNVKAGAI